MSRVRHRLALLLAVAGLAGLAARAAEAPPPLLSLEQAIAIAESHNRRLAAADAAVEIRAARIGEARAARAPQIALGQTVARTTDPASVFTYLLRQENFRESNFDVAALNEPDGLNQFSTRIDVEQPLWSGGRTRHDVAAARLRHASSELTRESTRQQVVRDVVAAYTATVLAEGQRETAREALRTARANVELVTDLESAGLVVASDRLQAEVRESEVQELLIRAESGVELSRARVNLVLGRDLGTPFAPASAIDTGPEPDEALDSLLALAREKRPELQSVQLEEQALDHDIRGARAARRPQIGLHGSYEAAADNLFQVDGTNWTALAAARFTLFDGGATRSRVRQAEGRLRLAQSERDALRDGIELEVRESFLERRAARQRLEQTARAVELARESLRIVRDRYGEGLTSVVELLDGEAALTRASTRQIAARRDLLLAGVALDLAVGRL